MFFEIRRFGVWWEVPEVSMAYLPSDDREPLTQRHSVVFRKTLIWTWQILHVGICCKSLPIQVLLQGPKICKHWAWSANRSCDWLRTGGVYNPSSLISCPGVSNSMDPWRITRSVLQHFCLGYSCLAICKLRCLNWSHHTVPSETWNQPELSPRFLLILHFYLNFYQEWTQTSPKMGGGGNKLSLTCF
jgi:hypothetical protein